MTEDEQEASITELGFLSPAIEYGVQFVRAANRDWFDLAFELSAYGQWLFSRAVKAIAGLSGTDPKAVATQCMIRTLSNFQGAVLLAERGMIIEARTLVRGCYENTLWLGALIQKPAQAITELEFAELASEISLRRAAIKSFKDQPDWPPEFAEKLEAGVVELEKRPRKKPISMAELAKMADLGPIYPLYKRLSSDAAHPSIRSLNRHVTPIQEGNLVEYVLGPDSEGVPEVLHLACHAFFAALTFFRDVAGPDESDDRLPGLVQSFQKLTGSDAMALTASTTMHP